MTDTPPNPKRRRWRWLVGGLLLFSMAGWWLFHSKVDPRLVGKWAVTGGPVPAVMDLRGNGQAFMGLADDSKPYAGKWSVAGGRITFGTYVPQSIRNVGRQVQRLYFRATGRIISLFSPNCYEILDVDAGHVHLQSTSRRNEKLTLTRINE